MGEAVTVAGVLLGVTMVVDGAVVLADAVAETVAVAVATAVAVADVLALLLVAGAVVAGTRISAYVMCCVTGDCFLAAFWKLSSMSMESDPEVLVSDGLTRLGDALVVPAVGLGVEPEATLGVVAGLVAPVPLAAASGDDVPMLRALAAPATPSPAAPRRATVSTPRRPPPP